MSQNGLFVTTDADPRNVTKGFGAATVNLQNANNAPLLTALSASADRSYNDVRIEWAEKQPLTGLNAIIGTQDGPQGCYLVLADGCIATTHSLFMVVATGEIFRVLGSADNVVTVKRGFGGTPISEINPQNGRGVVIQRIGSAFPEGSERPEPFTHYTTTQHNYNQIFRNTYALTRTAAMRNYLDGDLRSRLRQEMLMMHMRDIEMSILFSVKSMSHENGKPLRTMDGMYRQIKTNIAAPVDGILTVPMLDHFIERIMSQQIEGASQSRIAICGRGFLTFINRLHKMSTQYQVDGTENFHGQNITKWVTPHGAIDLVPHDIMTQVPGYQNDLLILHPDALSLHYMYEGTEDNMHAQGNQGFDGHIGGIITEMTTRLKGELTCGILTGVCDVAAEPQPFYLKQPHKPMPRTVCPPEKLVG